MNEPIYLDRLDRILNELVDAHEDGISLSEMRAEYPELNDVPRTTLWYRINSLAENGYIKIKRARRNVMCYPTSQEQA